MENYIKNEKFRETKKLKKNKKKMLCNYPKKNERKK